MEQLKNEDTVAIATKIPRWLYERFKAISEVGGSSMYEVLQKIIELFLLTADKFDDAPEEMQKIVHDFQHILGWKNQFSLADSKDTIKVTEATYFLQGQGRDGHRALHLREPFFGEWESTFNEASILETCLAYTTPDLYRRLRIVGGEEECQTAEETIDLMTREYLRKHRDRLNGIDEMFSDNRRGEWGQQPNEQGPYVQKKKRGEDNEADRHRLIEEFQERNQMKLDFNQEEYDEDESLSNL